MNKLQEILHEFDKITLGYCDDDELDEMSYIAGQAHFKQYICEFIKEKLVEYARSKTPEDIPHFYSRELLQRKCAEGYQFCRHIIRNSIEEDLKSLT